MNQMICIWGLDFINVCEIYGPFVDPKKILKVLGKKVFMSLGRHRLCRQSSTKFLGVSDG